VSLNKKVVLLIQENAPKPIGGIERHCYSILELFKDDPKIEIKSLNKELVSNKKLKFINKIIFSFREIKDHILTSRADTVHIHGFASLVVFQSILIASYLNKKIIYTPHFHPFHTLNNPKQGKVFFSLLLRPLLKKIHTIICINDEDLSFFRKYNINLIRIPNWLNNQPSLSQVLNGKRLQKKDMILFVGRADDNKGIHYIERIDKKKYDIHCVCNEHFNKEFTFHHSISDTALEELYYTAKLVVIPSRYEAFSYVALEALVHGTKILASDRVRILDYFRNDNSMVNQFRYGNHDEFINKIDSIMDDNTNDDTASTLADIEKTFDKEAIKKLLVDLY
jgi:glycosyltransferase involved in cell wall biosynthesis